MTARLPAHLEVAGLIRAVETAGGFGAVLRKGERDAGSILLLTMDKGGSVRLWERLPRLDGTRKFAPSREQVTENKQDFEDYLARRGRQDPDSWLVELDIADAARLIAEWSG